jgi:hypothetical protein
MKTFDEVEKYLQENPVKNPMNLFDIEKILESYGFRLPDNITIHSEGIGSIDFIRWFESDLQYPNTYEECCSILNLPHSGLTIDVPLHYSITLIYLTKLLICRDAYWKIAGDWRPDWETTDRKWSIYNYRGSIKWDYFTIIDRQILVFPTDEMRNAFYENFKDLIEVCKDLL